MGDLRAKFELMRQINVTSTLMEQGDYEKSYEISAKVFPRLRQLVGPDDEDLLGLQSNMADCLDRLERSEESIALYRETLGRMKRKWGDNHMRVLSTEMNMADVLMTTGKIEEAHSIFARVFERRKGRLGPDHPNTLRAQQNFARALMAMMKLTEALDMFTSVFNKEKELYGLDHPYTLITHRRMAQVLMKQSKHLEALRILNLVLAKHMELAGEDHPDTTDTMEIIEELKVAVGPGRFSELQSLCRATHGLPELLEVIGAGDVHGTMELLNGGFDITQVTAEKGNTPLHLAVNKNNMDIIGALLEYAKQHLQPSKLVDFLDAKTTSAVGNTALHIAACNESMKAMKTLLRFGATYNIKNKKGKTPYEQSNAESVKEFLLMVDELFAVSRRGDKQLVSEKLKELADEDRSAVTGARDSRGCFLQQIMKNA